MRSDSGRVRKWGRLPPIMERSPRDDLKSALFILLGVTTGYFLIGADDPGTLVAAVVGLVALTIVLNVVRGVRRHRKT